ncbi:MAG: hypothetical protein HY287_12080, partial [Planctomycetes bacterium]|nr:hypothetical protein [Planctomycetota bacterium]
MRPKRVSSLLVDSIVVTVIFISLMIAESRAALPGGTIVVQPAVTGACCDPATGNCTLLDQLTCQQGGGSFQGAGTLCDADSGYDAALQTCCPQPVRTGADQCGDAIVHVIHVPPPGGDPVGITISGNSIGATQDSSDFECILCGYDGCYANAFYTLWWESFSIDACAYVLVDSCCTGHYVNFLNGQLEPSCTCNPGFNPSPNPHQPLINGAPEPAFGSGPPHCSGADYWSWYGPLSAGTYYLPIVTDYPSYHGPYQLHVTAYPCVPAACCMQSTCEVKNELDCSTQGGNYLGPPLHNPAIDSCDSSPCSTGVCCMPAGACDDSIGTMNQTDCELTLGGNYAGGVRCHGGVCCNIGETCSTNVPGQSCAADDQCSTSQYCAGTPQQPAQPPICPLCSIQGSFNCQAWDYAAIGGMSNRSLGSAGTLIADDFVPLSSELSHLCVWGRYLDSTAWPSGDSLDCGASVSADHFRARVYDNFEGLPCELIAESAASVSRLVVPEGALDYQPGGPLSDYLFELILDVPVSGLIAGGNWIYWLEVSNDPDSSSPTCRWFWDQVSASGRKGNHYSASGSGLGYKQGSERFTDYAWCMDGNVARDASGDVVRSCCDCLNGTCTLTTLAGCNSWHTIWDVDNQSASCSGCELGGAPNDHCSSTIGNLIPSAGTYVTHTQCADTDGPQLGLHYKEGPIIYSDVWYRYQALADCTLVVSMCGTGHEYDSMLAVYHKPGDCSFCPTDANNGNQYLVNGQFEDESCTGVPTGGAGISVSQAQAGECYVIRVGGYSSSRGSGTVDIGCAGVAVAGCPQSRCEISDSPLPISGEPDQNRYISFFVPAAGENAQVAGSAIEVKLVSLYHPVPPDLVWVPLNFTAWEGQSRWVGPPQDCAESEILHTNFKCAHLQCTPSYTDWNAALGTQPLRVTGADIMPSSIYEVREFGSGCMGQEAMCCAVSAPL